MNMKSIIGALSLSACFVVVTGCTAQAACNKEAECQNEENDRELEADSTAVCVEQVNGSLAALRANDEEDCQVLADAFEAFLSCKAGLKCDDYFEDDLGGECDDQIDDLQDAQEDVSGFECTAQD